MLWPKRLLLQKMVMRMWKGQSKDRRPTTRGSDPAWDRRTTEDVVVVVEDAVVADGDVVVVAVIGYDGGGN